MKKSLKEQKEEILKEAQESDYNSSVDNRGFSECPVNEDVDTSNDSESIQDFLNKLHH